MKVGIIGAGRVGKCLAFELLAVDMLVGLTASTESKNTLLAMNFHKPCMTNKKLWEAADVLLICVPDRLIGSVAAEIAAQVKPATKVVLHVSGSMGLEPLAPLAKLGAHVGSLHPLQSFADRLTRLKGVYMAIDGDDKAQRVARKLVKLFGGKPFSVPANERGAYHAAACLCSNYAVAVETLATQLMARWTGSEESAWEALLPLFCGTAENLGSACMPGEVLTGPIARGDVTTVEKHLQALSKEFLPVYCSLGLVTTKLALANGTIDKEVADKLQSLLTAAV